MAGTGNLDVLRIARQLHKRHSVDVSYGSHMAVHMAIGLLFLGGGRYDLVHTGFVRVLENLESHGILFFSFPGLESHGILCRVMESHGKLNHYKKLRVDLYCVS